MCNSTELPQLVVAIATKAMQMLCKDKLVLDLTVHIGRELTGNLLARSSKLSMASLARHALA